MSISPASSSAFSSVSEPTYNDCLTNLNALNEAIAANNKKIRILKKALMECAIPKQKELFHKSVIALLQKK